MTKKIRLVPDLPCPCKGCIDRVLRCHSKCEKYAEYRKSIDAISEKRRKAMAIEEIVRIHRCSSNAKFKNV